MGHFQFIPYEICTFYSKCPVKAVLMENANEGKPWSQLCYKSHSIKVDYDFTPV